MRSRSALFGIVLLASSAGALGTQVARAAGAVVTADEKAAAADAAKANKALAARNYRSAADGFESAFKRARHPKWLFSAAGARQKNGDLAQAANAYARYLREAPDTAPQRPAAKKALAALGAKLGQLEVKADGASVVTIDGETIDPGATSAVYVNPGAHLVEARFGDQSVKESPTVTIGQLSTVVLALPAEVPAAAPIVEKEPPAAAPVTPERARPLPPIVVWIGAGVTVVAGGLTLVSGLDVLSQKDSFDANRSQQNLDDGKGKQLRTNILFAVTGTAAVLTGVAAIWFVNWKGTSSKVKVGAGPGSIVIGGVF